MNKIKAAIIEDEIPAARLLRDTLLSLRPDWEVQLLPGNIEEAVEWFGQHPHPDILFLDIQLTDGNSFLFIEQAHPESMIVFTTAYDEYAVRAFSVNSIDYLLKPIHEDRLMQTKKEIENYQVPCLAYMGDMGDMDCWKYCSNFLLRRRPLSLCRKSIVLVSLFLVARNYSPYR